MFSYYNFSMILIVFGQGIFYILLFFLETLTRYIILAVIK